MNEEEKDELIKIIIDITDFFVDEIDDKKKKIKTAIRINELSKKYVAKLNIILYLLSFSKSYYYKLIKEINEQRINNTLIIDKRIRDDKEYILFLIKKIYFESNKVFGAKRIRLILTKTYEIKITYKTVFKYMNELNLKYIIRRKNTRRIDAKNTQDQTKNILNRNFEININNKTICTDVTYIKFLNKWVYLSAAISLTNNKIIAWNLSTSNNNELVMDTFKNVDLSKYNMIHSDHGVQYTSKDFKNLLIENNIIQSMSRVGNSLDNRPIEYWFSIIKTEYLNLKIKKIKTFDQLISLIDESIKDYNNRIQPCLQCLTPHQLDIIQSKQFNQLICNI